MATDTRTATPTAPPPPPPSVGAAVGRALGIVALVLLGGGAIVGGLFLWGWFATTTDESVTAHPSVDRLELDLRAIGDVAVRVHDRDDIVVEERIRTSFASVQPEQRVDGDVLTLATPRCDPPINLLPLNRCSVSYVVRVPADTEVSGSLRHGSIEVAGLTAPVTLETDHGGIDVAAVDADVAVATGHGRATIGRVTGAVRVESGHGRLDLARVDGEIDARTGHGQVSVRDSGGGVDVTTGHGSVDVDGTAGDVVSVATGHGSVTFATTTAPTDVRAVTGHGSVTVWLPRDAPPYAVTTDTDRSVDVQVDTDPGADRRLDLATGHGSIEVLTR